MLNFHSPYFRISAADLDKVLVGYIQLRDPAGTDASESGSHGDGFDRLSALSDGINTGVTYCYAADWDKRTFTERPFTSDTDYATGGNETEAEVLNPGTADAGRRRPAAEPERRSGRPQAKTIGKTFTPVKIAEADHPPCLTASGDDAASSTTARPTTPSTTASRSPTRPTQYGDYALGTLFVYGWGLAVRHQLFGRSIDDQAGAARRRLLRRRLLQEHQHDATSRDLPALATGHGRGRRRGA